MDPNDCQHSVADATVAASAAPPRRRKKRAGKPQRPADADVDAGPQPIAKAGNVPRTGRSKMSEHRQLMKWIKEERRLDDRTPVMAATARGNTSSHSSNANPNTEGNRPKRRRKGAGRQQQAKNKSVATTSGSSGWLESSTLLKKRGPREAKHRRTMTLVEEEQKRNDCIVISTSRGTEKASGGVPREITVDTSAASVEWSVHGQRLSELSAMDKSPSRASTEEKKRSRGKWDDAVDDGSARRTAGQGAAKGDGAAVHGLSATTKNGPGECQADFWSSILPPRRDGSESTSGQRENTRASGPAVKPSSEWCPPISLSTSDNVTTYAERLDGNDERQGESNPSLDSCTTPNYLKDRKTQDPAAPAVWSTEKRCNIPIKNPQCREVAHLSAQEKAHEGLTSERRFDASWEDHRTSSATTDSTGRNSAMFDDVVDVPSKAQQRCGTVASGFGIVARGLSATMCGSALLPRKEIDECGNSASADPPSLDFSAAMDFSKEAEVKTNEPKQTFSNRLIITSRPVSSQEKRLVASVDRSHKKRCSVPLVKLECRDRTRHNDPEKSQDHPTPQQCYSIVAVNHCTPVARTTRKDHSNIEAASTTEQVTPPAASARRGLAQRECDAAIGGGDVVAGHGCAAKQELRDASIGNDPRFLNERRQVLQSSASCGILTAFNGDASEEGAVTVMERGAAKKVSIMSVQVDCDAARKDQFGEPAGEADGMGNTVPLLPTADVDEETTVHHMLGKVTSVETKEEVGEVEHKARPPRQVDVAASTSFLSIGRARESGGEELEESKEKEAGRVSCFCCEREEKDLKSLRQQLANLTSQLVKVAEEKSELQREVAVLQNEVANRTAEIFFMQSLAEETNTEKIAVTNQGFIPFLATNW